MKNLTERLFLMTEKKSRTIIGLMSGTSIDGLDIALCEIEGSGLCSRVNVVDFETFIYSEEWRARLASLSAAHSVNSELLCTTNAQLGRLHAEMINQFLYSREMKSEEIDLIASHGHSFFHVPASNFSPYDFSSTFQIGDADHIATLTGIITVSDFRQKHIACGGEGAPLAPYGDILLFGEEERDVILLNIGGIANFSFLPARNHPAKMIFGDTGPGNCLMDAWVRKHQPGSNYDHDGQWARKGKIINTLLQQLLSEAFFQKPFPKSTGKELFNEEYLSTAIKKTGLPEQDWMDILATLNSLTSLSIAQSLKNILRKEIETFVYVSGGGKHNPLLMEGITAALKNENIQFRSTLEKGIPSDAKEAVIFALLANEAVAGNIADWAVNYPPLVPINMGRISFPR